jgi:hypothetical protein
MIICSWPSSACGGQTTAPNITFWVFVYGADSVMS